MLKWLLRLTILALLAGAVGLIVTRLLGQDEDDFDEFDDLDGGFDFQETPVEIDVPVEESAQAAGPASVEDESNTITGRLSMDDEGDAAPSDRLIDIKGIGPAYEARLQALGITTFSALTQVNPEELADQFGVVGGADAVREWIEQARQMMDSEGANQQRQETSGA